LNSQDEYNVLLKEYFGITLYEENT
jgi:hypothetical protein